MSKAQSRSSLNTDNEISVKDFLLGNGGNCHDFNRVIDGFHCITKEFDFNDSDDNFDKFIEQIEYCLSAYCWDTNSYSVIDRVNDSEEDGCQCFEMPKKEIIRNWYEELKVSQN